MGAENDRLDAKIMAHFQRDNRSLESIICEAIMVLIHHFRRHGGFNPAFNLENVCSQGSTLAAE
jgi:hypothetical protein